MTGSDKLTARASYPVSHVEWEVKNGQQSADFLTRLFGWQFQKFSAHYWLYQPATGVAIGLFEKATPQPVANACPVFIDVGCIDSCLARAGKPSLVEPKTLIAGYGAWAKIKEPNGNVIGLFERLRD